jgi:DNA helicase IV
VLVPDAAAAAVLAELRAAEIDAHPLEEDADPRVTVVAAATAKGLEFDSVVLVGPAAIVAGEPSRIDGLRRLYVLLTRAVSRLRIVHDDPLPPELG